MDWDEKQVIPEITQYILHQHKEEWTTSTQGMITYQKYPDYGYVIIFRTPTLGKRRLVSVRILLEQPAKWPVIRTQMLERGYTKLLSAKYRYLIVSSELFDDAKRVMAKTKVIVLPLPVCMANTTEKRSK